MKSSSPTAKDIVDMFGGQAALAEILSGIDEIAPEVSYKTCQNWVLRDRIPGDWFYPLYLAAQQREIETVTMKVLLEHGARKIMKGSK